MTLSSIRTWAVASLLFVVPTAAISAETHIVEMLNKHPDNPKIRQVFYPPVIKVEVGDTVRFVSSDKGHNSASIDGMIPEGADEWKSKLGREFEIKITQDGTYGFVCTPHYGLGMVGLILAGDYSVNLDAAKEVKHRGKAKKVFKELFETL
ncbi:MAG: pseudoazurin [Rhizobiaceae bacterium]